MSVRDHLQAVASLARGSLRRLAVFQVRRRSAAHMVALIAAPLFLSGVAVVAQAPAKPVAASWCVLSGWTLTYHDSAAWRVTTQGYDGNGNWQSISINTPSYSNYDGNHCWQNNQVLNFYWYGATGNYLSHTTKSLPARCNGWFPAVWCYTTSSDQAQVYGP